MPVQLQSVFSENGKDKAGMCRTALIDISERKQAEERIVSVNTQLEKNIAELSACNTELESFSYAISHDLKAPLRSIAGFTKIIMDDYANVLDEQGKDYFNRTIKAANRMSGLLDDLLKLSFVARTDLASTTVNLSALASDITRRLSAEEPDRRVDVVIREGLHASGNVNLLRALLENLIGNAWKFTIKQEHARIELGAIEKDNARVYFVKDNGIGFDMAWCHKLFVPFQRLVSEKEFVGTGIGLSLAHRIVIRHGGSIWAESEPGKGATFYFTLPPAESSSI
jgi:light-regulated signal transduction histidine kinase (bacteriophytochrome)